MSPIRAPATLPALAERFPNREARPAGQTKSYALLQNLRSLANALRRTKPQPFYAMRAVATHFGVSLRLVARVYAELEREGLLMRFRGAMTMLTPHKAKPRVPVRGVVGVPVWDYGYCTLADWRFFFSALEEELRRRHFVADFVFYRSAEPVNPDFAERLLAHNLDYLLWFKPIPTYASNLQRLAEGGVHVAVLHDYAAPFPFSQYRLDVRQASRRALADWRRAGLRTVCIVTSGPLQPDCIPFWLESAARRAGLRTVLLDTSKTNQAASALEPLRDEPRAGLIIADQYAEVAICQQSPESLTEVLRKHRALFHYRLDLWPGALAGCKIDLAGFDWSTVAARIANDVATGALQRQRTPVIFEAAWRPRVQAAAFAQVF